MDAEPIILDWAAVERLSLDLVDRARVDGTPDVVVGVLRGGMVPAVLVAHQLGLRDIRAADVTRTTSDEINAAKTARPTRRHLAALGELDGANVLIVDDIAGSGATARVVARLVAERGASQVRTAVCVINRANWVSPTDPHTTLTYVGATVEGWVIFPWEKR